MKKKEIFMPIVLILFITMMLALTVWYLTKEETTTSTNNNNPTVNVYQEQNDINLPDTGNDYIIKTHSDTSFRVINEYTTEFFTANKNLLIMFGSWCSHCREELTDVEQIVKHYKDNKNVNVILIAHEYKDTISDLTTLVEQEFSFGSTEIFIDLKRIIRGTLDPEASTVPIAYVVDKNGNVLEKNNGSITLDIAKELLK